MAYKTNSSATTLDCTLSDRTDQIRIITEAPDSAVVDTKQASLFLGVAPQTLEVWRCTRRQALPYLKLGRSVRYLMGDLRKFQAKCRVNSDALGAGGAHEIG